MIHPRSFDLDEQRPALTQWICDEHGDLPPGESVCPERHCVFAESFTEEVA